MMKRIKGTWADGRTATAEQYHNGVFDGEWMDDHFGQAFDFALEFIGEDKDTGAVQAHAKHSFWDGVCSVVYVGSPVAEVSEREVAFQRRRLVRCSDPLTYAAIVICTLKRELFAARDQGEDSEIRASGRMRCEVCGDTYDDHASTYCPSAVGICTGARYKL